MSRSLDELVADALELDTKSRAELAEKLLESLDDLRPEDIQKLWGEEAQRRLDDLRAGRAKEIPGPEALRRALDAIA